MKRNSGLQKRWLRNTLSILFAIVLLCVIALSIMVAAYYYSSMEAGMEAKARTSTSFFDNYVRQSYNEYYQSCAKFAQSFDSKDQMELQFVNTNNRIVASSYGVYSGMAGVTSDIREAIETKAIASYTGTNPATGERIMAVSSPLIYTNGEVIGVLSRMTTVVSMRLHGLIFAAGQGVPLIGVAYDPKVTAFLDYVEQTNYMQFEAVNEEDLSDQIDAAVALAGRGEELRRRTELLNRQEDNNRATAARLLGKE